MSGTGHSEREGPHSLVVVGMSAGGLVALDSLIRALPAGLSCAVVIAQHVAGPTLLPGIIESWTAGRFAPREVTDGMPLEAGVIYVCPSQTHVAVNPDATMTVSTKERVDYVRPSIDWLFDSAAASFGDRCIAVVLSGANSDAARGVRAVARAHGTVIVQAPDDSQYPAMPRAAIATGVPHVECRIAELGKVIIDAVSAIEGSASRAAWTDPFAAPS